MYSAKDHFVYAPSRERWHYNATSSLIGWAHPQNDPCSAMGVGHPAAKSPTHLKIRHVDFIYGCLIIRRDLQMKRVAVTRQKNKHQDSSPGNGQQDDWHNLLLQQPLLPSCHIRSGAAVFASDVTAFTAKLPPTQNPSLCRLPLTELAFPQATEQHCHSENGREKSYNTCPMLVFQAITWAIDDPIQCQPACIIGLNVLIYYDLVTSYGDIDPGFYTKGRLLVKPNLICPSDKFSWQPGCPVLNINIQGKISVSAKEMALRTTCQKTKCTPLRSMTISTLVQVMACCLTATSHCLNQCLLIIMSEQGLKFHSSDRLRLVKMTVGQVEYLQDLSDGRLCISDFHVSCIGFIYFRQVNGTFGQVFFRIYLPDGQVHSLWNFEAWWKMYTDQSLMCFNVSYHSCERQKFHLLISLWWLPAFRGRPIFIRLIVSF